MPQEHVWKSTETHLRETQIAIKDNQCHLRHLLCSDRPLRYHRYKNLIIYERTMQAYRRHRCRNPQASGEQFVGGSTRHCIIRNLFCSIVKFSKNKGGFVVSISITVQPTLLSLYRLKKLRNICFTSSESASLLRIVLLFSNLSWEKSTTYSALTTINLDSASVVFTHGNWKSRKP